MYIGHVGDSRCYRVRDGQIQQLTRDHSLINDYLLAMPDLTEEQKSELPEERHHARARDAGPGRGRPPARRSAAGRRLRPLLGRPVAAWSATTTSSSDRRQHDDIRDACRSLIERANERGGEDNITAVLIKIEEQDRGRDARPSPRRAGGRSSSRQPEQAPATSRRLAGHLTPRSGSALTGAGASG